MTFTSITKSRWAKVAAAGVLAASLGFASVAIAARAGQDDGEPELPPRIGFCWIRARLNTCSHPGEWLKTSADLEILLWAVTGSNRRPLRCKRSALPLS